MWTPSTLQTRYQLHEYTIYAIGYTIVLPFNFTRMFLTFVQQQRFHMVRCNRIAWQI